MKTWAIGMLVVLGIVSAGCGTQRAAQQAAESAPTANVAGTWTGSAGTGGVFVPVTMNLTQNGTDVGGNVKGEVLNLSLETVKLGQMFVKQQNTITGEVAGGMPVTLRRMQ